MLTPAADKSSGTQMAGRCRNKRKKLQKEPSIEDDTSDLPGDIIKNIVSRVPAKSLFRFKSVSKPWNGMISDSAFARIHLHMSERSASNFILLGSNSTTQKFTLLEITNHTFQEKAILEFPVKKYRLADILGSCLDVVLLRNRCENDQMFVLWSPSTRKYTKFSWPYELDPDRIITYGLCYDSLNDDLKVVWFVNKSSYIVFSYRNCSVVHKELFSIEMESSRTDPGVFVNGSLHWVFQNFELIKSYRTIYSFDPRDDRFRKFPKPVFLESDSKFQLTCLKGMLCLYQNTHNGTQVMVDIWMMKEYGNHNSWTKFPVIESVILWDPTCRVKPLYLTKEGNIALDISGFGLVIYIVKEMRLGEFRMHYPVSSEHRRRTSTPLVCLDSIMLPSIIKEANRHHSVATWDSDESSDYYEVEELGPETSALG